MAKPKLPTVPKKTKTRALPKSYDLQHLGNEPSWDANKTVRQSDIIRALNWYNYFNDAKSSFKMLKKNYVRDLKELDLLDKLPIDKISPTLGFVSRMMTLGCVFSEVSIANYHEKIEQLLEESKDYANISQKTKTMPSARVVSIAERVVNKANEYVGEFDGQIDEFMANNYKSSFSVYEYLTELQVKPMIAKAMLGSYDNFILELKEVLTKDDEQLNEGYAHLKPIQIRKLIAFLEGINDDILTYTNNGKKAKKPRKKKPISVTKQIEKMQYRKEFVELKLQSINPITIIGASQLWIYNTRYKKLTCFFAEDSTGFSVKGTSILNFSSESVIKTLRKPKEVLTKVQKGGKIVLRNIMNELTTRGTIPKGRINNDTILVRVIK
jgi:hypothetical protein